MRLKTTSRTWLWLPLLVGLLSGCAVPSTALLREEKGERVPGTARVIVMPLDIELSELTVGGLREPKADWTEQGRQHVAAALEHVLQSKRALVVPYQPPANSRDDEVRDDQLLKLHDAVGGAILVHKYVPILALPTKAERFDWTLGASVRDLQARSGADYALFVFFRDSYASPGRVALMVSGLFLGVSVPGGMQVGFASLVDLRTGNIVWFNRLLDPAGDLRTSKPAARAVESLLVKVPL